MKKFFNTTGPCEPERHYMLPPKERLIGADLERYLEHQLYWVLHAPRQTGKTTFLRSWKKEINESGKGIACYVTVEICQGVTEIERAIPAICSAICSSAKTAKVPILTLPQAPAERMLGATMAQWAEVCAPLPLIVLFDEVDVLEGPAMVSFLRQLRSGFPERGVGKFPTSIALVGMRDLRDYLAESKDGISVNPGSPFNIKQHSSSLSVFSREDIAKLTQQHTEATGQVFSKEAVERIDYWSGGQPWLVNAMCQMCAWDIVKEETRETVLAEHIEIAKEKLILSRATHLDSLAERLKMPNVKRVVETILTSETDATLGRNDRDIELCMDLGLVVWDKCFKIANPIYKEVVARTLSLNYQDNVPEPEFAWQKSDGTADMDALLKEFQGFWAWNSDAWAEKADYAEAFPHLVLMAFLQRILNGGGQIHREYAAGRGRMDLFVVFGGKKHLVEIKLVHPRMGREKTLQKSLEQVMAYASTVAPDTCHLVIFDRRPEWREKPWEERLGWEEQVVASRSVTVVWC